MTTTNAYYFQHLFDSFLYLYGWWRILVPTQVDDHPGDVPQEGDGNLGVDEGEKGLNYSQLYDVVSQVGTVAYYVA